MKIVLLALSTTSHNPGAPLSAISPASFWAICSWPIWCYVSADDAVANLVDPGLARDMNLPGCAPLPIRTFFFNCFEVFLGANAACVWTR